MIINYKKTGIGFVVFITFISFITLSSALAINTQNDILLVWMAFMGLACISFIIWYFIITDNEGKVNRQY